jgi:Tol biopolymer transport system component
MRKNLHFRVAIWLFVLLPILACVTTPPNGIDPTKSPNGFTSTQLPDDILSTQLPTTQQPAATGTGESLPPGGCPENLGRIVFSYDPRDLESVHYGIYRMDPDGSNRIRLSAAEALHDSDPAWSPERCRIAFTSFTHEGDDDIYVMSADGTSIRRLTTDPARDMFPDWSPDGKHISFISYRDGFRNLYVMNADGSDQRQLTTNKAEYSQWQQWSPTGDEIAFTYQPEGDESTSIYVIHPDGSGLRQVAPPVGSMGDREPAWSPDGKKIYVLSNRSSLTEIWVMNLDGSGLQQVTSFGDSLTPEHSLRVSPDGTRLAFFGTGPENQVYASEIYVVDLDGSGLTDITYSEGQESWLDW